MKLIYKGKFDGNQDSLPCREHKQGAVAFKEAKTPAALAVIANIMCIVIMAVLAVVFVMRINAYNGESLFSYKALRYINLWGIMMSFVTLFPHEFLHAICFKEEVYLYTNWSQGMLFVVGTEDMSKLRFVVMSMCPNLVFGIIPYIAFLINPQLTFFGTMGLFAVGMGAGDYYNVFNALTQMPKGARTYLYKFNSFWYMPEERCDLQNDVK